MTHQTFTTAEALPLLPHPWQPDKRLSENLEFSDIVMQDARFEHDGRQSLLNFCNNAIYKYIIPGHAVDMLNATMLGLPKGEIGNYRNMLQTVQTEGDETKMMQRFEAGLLKLAPHSSSDGLYYYASAADFANAQYPVDAVAKTIGVKPEVILSELQDDEAAIRHIMIRSGNFLFSVYKNNLHTDLVTVPDIYELTELGSAVLETSLQAYAEGMRSSQK